VKNGYSFFLPNLVFFLVEFKNFYFCISFSAFSIIDNFLDYFHPDVVFTILFMQKFCIFTSRSDLVPPRELKYFGQIYFFGGQAECERSESKNEDLAKIILPEPRSPTCSNFI